ncbi:hypothetical protein EG329_009359 [Mollisiaceae sp. DMI_Dod_QoI]|nr:hypothetical protein EG329_009359 [Helotiales sp. DMI_Dod_QoI]
MSVLFPLDRHRTASITHLEFANSIEDRRSGGGMGCLPDILLSIKSLESFTLEFITAWGQETEYTNSMDPRTIGQLLHIHASTLVQLEIAASDSAEFPTTSLIGSLAGYTNLKKLAIPEPFLGGTRDEFWTIADVLPPNLEELQLQFPMLFIQQEDKDRAIRIKRLEELAAAKLARFPALRRVIWWYQPAECWDDGVGLRFGPISDMDHLTVTFRKVGVKFEWVSTTYFDYTPFKDRDENWWEFED